MLNVNILIDACMKHFGGDFMYKKKGEFVKLTIRIDTEELKKFKKVCEVRGMSANNQINVMIKEFNYFNKNYFVPTMEINE